MGNITVADLLTIERVYARLHADETASALNLGYPPPPPIGVGIGQQKGRLRPDHGPNNAHLTCTECDATWVGPIGQTCGWCEDRITDIQERQTARNNQPPPAETVPGWNKCPTHEHVWKGLPLEVCGAHGGPTQCNERGRPLPVKDAQRLVARNTR